MAEPLRITCPKCRAVIKAPPQAAGKRVKCPGCGHGFTAGITAEAIAAKLPASFTPVPHPDVPEVELVSAPPPPVIGPSITYVCDKCGRYGQAPAHNAGMIFSCGCGGMIQVPDLARFGPTEQRRTPKPQSRREGVGVGARFAIWAWCAIGGFAAVVLLCGGAAAFLGSGSRIFTEGADAADFLAYYGPPDEIDTTEFSQPRPPIVTKILIYRRAGVRVWCVPDAPFGTPPPYSRWVIARLVGAEERAPIEPAEAARRMRRR